MAVVAAAALVPPGPTPKDRESEMRRLLKVVLVMFGLAVLTAVVLGVQLKREQLKIETLATSSFAQLRQDHVFTVFVAERASRDDVHGSLQVDPESGQVVLGFSAERWTYNFATRTLRGQDGRYLSGDSQAVVTEQPGAPIDLFVEPYSNRMFVHSRGLWLVRAEYPPRRGGRATCVWTCSAQSVPEMFFGSWTALPQCGKTIEKGVLCSRC
jgi:hypothetical protein